MEICLFSKLKRGKFNRDGQRNELELPLGKRDIESGVIFALKQNKNTYACEIGDFSVIADSPRRDVENICGDVAMSPTFRSWSNVTLLR